MVRILRSVVSAIHAAPRSAKFLAFVLYGCATTIGIVIGIMYFDREPPVGKIQVRVLTPEVHAGEELVLSYSLRRIRDCRSISERILMDGDGDEYRLETIPRLSVGDIGKSTYKRVIPVPAGATPGTGRYRVVVSYVCNPVHNIWPIVVTFVNAKFEILPYRGAILPQSYLFDD